jgi:ABC-type multidrug transport system fused ATPase/permease subunit
MKFILKVFNLKRTLILSALVLVLLIIFSFYGPYTSKFYFFKPGNYIFPILSVGHFIYLYVVWFKTREEEMTDPQMRNLEYVLYGIFLIYIYKFVESIYILTTYEDYGNHVLPESFVSLGIFISVLYFLLIFLSLVLFKHRKVQVGNYKFDDMNHIDSWE